MQLGEVHFSDARLDMRTGAAGMLLTLHVASATGAISGVARDDKGPAGGSQVVLIEADAVANTIFGSVKEDGSYTFTGVPPGKYRIVVYQDDWRNEDVEDIGETIIEIRDHETLTKDLKKHPMPGTK